MQTVERSVSPYNAINVLKEELDKLGLTYKLIYWGDKIKTYRCYLYDHHGNNVAIGNGKGLGEQSLASSFYESLEHFMTEPNNLKEKSENIPISRIAKSDLLGTEKVIQMLGNQKSESKIPCKVYRGLTNNNKLYYPVFLSVPNYFSSPNSDDSFDYKHLSKYSTNNGTAIGLNITEATIHAICELLERDALSCFLLKTYISNLKLPIRILNRGSLPLKLQVLIENVESCVGETMTLVDISNDFQVPVCLAIINNHKSLLPYVGSGASLEKSYAIERAVLETLQSFHLYNDDLEKEDMYILHKFSELKKYKKCVSLDLDEFLTINQYTEVNYNKLPCYKVSSDDLDSYLTLLLSQISKNGYSVYLTENFKSSSGITCVHCVIPGLEKFHLVRSGIEVLPSDRGLGLLETLKLR